MRGGVLTVVALLLVDVLLVGWTHIDGGFPKGEFENASSHWNSNVTVSVGTAEVTGPFTGYLTVPRRFLNETDAFLNSINVTLYVFTVEVTGKELNASMSIPVLRLSPAFVPRDFNVSINGHMVTGVTYVPYAERLPVAVWSAEGSLETTSYLTVHPEDEKAVSGRWSAEYLNNASGSVLLEAGELELALNVTEPNRFKFVVLHNGTEVSSGVLGVDQ
ncbi:hypothetical protein [Thermococcus sp. MV11]|uniref:hypothetical protein n=1 Tax=Thermococcus sp. MV11 TaxID=1638267 RepID=UPI0014322966|nr:hypothetical protein [Thermococcus sp. MV11]NJE03211.1 hypothetical protein [Thermococcus sp. MV11]